MILATNAGIQLIIAVTCPRLGARNWKLLARPGMFHSSSAKICRRPGRDANSSEVPIVEVEPRNARFLLGSCRVTLKICETARIIEGLDEFARISLILS
jgi:hypothetical protein